MKKNVAGQAIGAQMVSTLGVTFAGTTTIYITGDTGSQTIGSVGSGVCTHKGQGYHQYLPAQAETNFDYVAFTFIGSGAIPATVQVYPDPYPPTGDPYPILSNSTYGNSALSGSISTILARLIGTILAGNHNPQSGDAYGVVNSSTFGNSASKAVVDSINAIVGNSTYGNSGLYSAIGSIEAGASAGEVATAILSNTTNKILTDANGYVTANVTGSITVSGDVTLASVQPNYAPAKAGDKMALTAPYDSTLSSILNSLSTLSTSVGLLPTSVSTLSASDVWNFATRTLTESGSTLSAEDVWTYPTRTVTGATISATISSGGTGAIEWVYELTSTVDGTPIADADVWVTSDAEGEIVLASGRTDQYGRVTFYLDAGTVYVWSQKTGWNFTNPDTEVVS